MSLADSVLAAANHLEAGGTENDEVLDETAEETPTEETSDDENEESPDEEVLDEASLKEAKDLYKALKDPTKALSVVSSLAGQLGLLQGQKQAPETKTEIKEAKKDIKEIFKQALGTEYSFLSDRLGNAIDQVFEQERADRQAEIATLSNQQIQRDSLAAMNALATRTKGESVKFEKQMVEMAKKILPAPGVTITEYLDLLYTSVTAGKTTSQVKRDVNDKIRRNANDVTGRLRSGGSAEKDNVGFDPNKKYSLKESVALAAKQISLQGQKK
jgi:hypothetical protein